MEENNVAERSCGTELFWVEISASRPPESTIAIASAANTTEYLITDEIYDQLLPRLKKRYVTSIGES